MENVCCDCGWIWKRNMILSSKCNVPCCLEFRVLALVLLLFVLLIYFHLFIFSCTFIHFMFIRLLSRVGLCCYNCSPSIIRHIRHFLCSFQARPVSTPPWCWSTWGSGHSFFFFFFYFIHSINMSSSCNSQRNHLWNGAERSILEYLYPYRENISCSTQKNIRNISDTQPSIRFFNAIIVSS